MEDRFNTPTTNVIELEAMGHRLRVTQDPNSKHVGTTVWDSSIVVLKYLERHSNKGEFSRAKLKGKRAIELGAGCGLAGLGELAWEEPWSNTGEFSRAKLKGKRAIELGAGCGLAGLGVSSHGRSRGDVWRHSNKGEFSRAKLKGKRAIELGAGCGLASLGELAWEESNKGEFSRAKLNGKRAIELGLAGLDELAWEEPWRHSNKGEFSRAKLKGKRAIELGAGCGLASLGFALLGCDVVLTDEALVLPLLFRNVTRLQSQAAMDAAADSFLGSVGSVEVAELWWGNAHHIAQVGPPFDTIVATDVVYIEDSVPALLATMLALSHPRTPILYYLPATSLPLFCSPFVILSPPTSPFAPSRPLSSSRALLFFLCTRVRMKHVCLLPCLHSCIHSACLLVCFLPSLLACVRACVQLGYEFRSATVHDRLHAYAKQMFDVKKVPATKVSFDL
ncbi:unnamed protein product [Closterium sp. Yama58-4]|nr:unnamed protein product [Closterium sp. Yama58-4]